MKLFPRIQDYLEQAAISHPQKNAVVFEEQKLTYAELDNMSTSLALCLIKLGLQPNDRIIIFLENSIESIISIYGIVKASCVFVVANHSIKSSQLNYLLNFLVP